MGEITIGGGGAAAAPTLGFTTTINLAAGVPQVVNHNLALATPEAIDVYCMRTATQPGQRLFPLISAYTANSVTLTAAEGMTGVRVNISAVV